MIVVVIGLAIMVIEAVTVITYLAITERIAK